MIQSFTKIERVSGILSLAGDKSIAHRALIISSLAAGKSKIKNLPESEDVQSTICCLESLGVEIEKAKNDCLIYGKGFKGFKPPVKPINAGNSGTTARLLTGILSVQNFKSTIEADSSLSLRPMKRVIEPLSLIGGNIESNSGKLPLHIFPSDYLNAINYTLPVSSAQVKSAILFAGLHLEEETSVTEIIQTRNHTENLLGLKVIKEEGRTISFSSKENYPEPKEYFIPGDVSSAMFFIVLTLLTKNSELIVKNVCLNPTRIEVVNVLKKMGAKIQIDPKGESNGEAFGDLIIKTSKLSNVEIDPEIIPQIIDEIPILSIAGVFADGEFKLRSASELRVKESDRIKSLCTNFRKLSLNVEELDDGFKVAGGIKNSFVLFDSFDDHRIAMAFAILSCLLKDGGSVEGIEHVSKSNPDFLNQLERISIL